MLLSVPDSDDVLRIERSLRARKFTSVWLLRRRIRNNELISDDFSFLELWIVHAF